MRGVSVRICRRRRVGAGGLAGWRRSTRRGCMSWPGPVIAGRCSTSYVTRGGFAFIRRTVQKRKAVEITETARMGVAEGRAVWESLLVGMAR